MDISSGDLVMFMDEGQYSKWFYGKLGVCINSTPEKRSCRVRWIVPVEYHGGYTETSDFGWDKFQNYGKR